MLSQYQKRILQAKKWFFLELIASQADHTRLLCQFTRETNVDYSVFHTKYYAAPRLLARTKWQEDHRSFSFIPY